MRERYFLRGALLICILMSTVLTRYNLSSWVVLVSTAAGAATSWTEYSDVQRKTERYTRAIFELQNLVSWWDSLSGVQKAGRDAISHLILSAEGIISDERLAWVSTAGKLPNEADENKEGEGMEEKDHNQ